MIHAAANAMPASATGGRASDRGVQRDVGVDDVDELRRLDGLHQMQVETRVAGASPVFFLAPAGDRDEPRVRGLWQPAEVAREIVAVAARESDVEKRDLRRERRREVLRGDTVVRD